MRPVFVNLLYKCDPEKNKKCAKTGCYIHGGPCSSTLNAKLAMTDENGKPIVNYDDLEERLEKEQDRLNNVIDI